MIKLLAIDMDGTCLDQRSRMTDRTLDVLRKAAKAGITVVPCTGRNLGCIPHRLAAGVLRESKTEDDEKNKDLFRYVITSNGAMVTDVKEKKTLFRALIKKEDALSILSDYRKEKFGIAAHVRHRYFAQGKLFTSAGRIVYGKDAAAVCCVRNMEEILSKSDCDVEELQFYFPTSKEKEKLKEILSVYPQVKAAYTGIYAEIFSKDASKGNGLKALSAHLGIEKEEIACIGDGENDSFMFEESGLKIAMGNAEEMLKQRADYVTSSNRHDGAAEAIEKYIL